MGTRFQNRSVSMSRRRSASLSRSRSAPMNPTRSVIRFPSRTASLFTRKFQTESAEGFPRRSVMMVQGLDMVLKHPGRWELWLWFFLLQSSLFVPFYPRVNFEGCFFYPLSKVLFWFHINIVVLLT